MDSPTNIPSDISKQGETHSEMTISLVDTLAEQNYWPARASKLMNEGKYSAVVELCKEHLSESSGLVSAQLLYALALYHSHQIQHAREQFYQVLHIDPENLAALKYLGDIAYTESDEFGAMSYYNRVLEIDPYCTGLRSEIKPRLKEEIKTVTLVRKEEHEPTPEWDLRDIPFYTETMGDLYLAQGHAKLAASVFRSLQKNSPSPRLVEKLKIAEERSK